ncbi:MAG: hypothetical protein QOD07_2869 [Frankiaceae bacterium]|jgi:hypothetical protein|nr:hypothetical protein [Frankiaceae bacterium]
MRAFVVPEGGSAATQDSYSQIIAIHAALLPTGQIVYFSGDQHDPGQFANHLFDSARLFDCESFTVSNCQPAPGITDLFCCGHALLEDGRVLIAGGTKRFDGFEGDPAAWIFDPATGAFTALPSMQDGRWYPTLVTLATGDVLAVSGSNAAGSDQNRQLEVFSPTFGTWSVQGMVTDAFESLYPRMHLLPSGAVFFVTPTNGQCTTWSPGTTALQPLCNPPVPHNMGFSAYTSVLLPLEHLDGYRPRVLVANIEQPQVIDLSATHPVWTPTGARNVPADGVLAQAPTPPRVNGMAVLLPTGEVMCCGGNEEGGDELHPVYAVEIFRPSTDTWLTLPIRTSVSRNYHSTALLMPDGRVWMSGSDKGCKWSFHDPADYPDGEPTDVQEIKTVGGVSVHVDNRELRVEIIEPWYFGRPDRPQFSLESDVTQAGWALSLVLSQPATISRVALLRAGTSTHAFDGDQRLVSVPFTQNGNNVTATLPSTRGLLPPGPYLVFASAQVVDPATGAVLDVPSEGVWVRVCRSHLVKPLKVEVDHLRVKEDFEFLGKEIVESIPDPWTTVGDPMGPEIIRTIATAVDELSAAVRPFIRAEERPELSGPSAAALAAVPIHPIDPTLMAAQMHMHMEGMDAMAGMEAAKRGDGKQKKPTARKGTPAKPASATPSKPAPPMTNGRMRMSKAAAPAAKAKKTAATKRAGKSAGPKGSRTGKR